jgi:hypothetical protein
MAAAALRAAPPPTVSVQAAARGLPPAMPPVSVPVPTPRAQPLVRPLSSDLVRGVLSPRVHSGSPQTPCCIISEGWPSWISVCLHYPSLFSSITVHAVTLPSAVLDTCRHHFSGWEWTNTIPHPVGADTVVLLQGSRRFLRTLPPHFLEGSTATSFNHEYMAGHRPLRYEGWHSATYCFTDYGGVICGRWRMLSRFRLPDSLASGHANFPNLRLCHFLDPTLRGGKQLPAEFCDKALTSTDLMCRSAIRHPTIGGWDARGFLVKGHSWLDRVVCPTVYGARVRSLRPLASKELAGIYHLPTSIHQEVDESWTFHLAAPGLLLKYLWDSIFEQVYARTRERPAIAAVSIDGEQLIQGVSGESSAHPAPRVSHDLDLGATQTLVDPAARPTDGFDFSIAVKADKAETPIFLWDERIWSLEYHSPCQRQNFLERFLARCPLTALRGFMLSRWRLRLTRSFVTYMRSCYGDAWSLCERAAKEREVGRDCLHRVAMADWWEWKDGSALFFWRWPRYARSLALLGHKPWFSSPPPRYKVPQRQESNETIRAQVKAKLETPLNRRYITPGRVESLTGFFSVPKGDDDLRMVYDASKSGLNASLWVPSFQLPTCETLTDLLSPDSWMADLDLGEHFHNFPLHEDLQAYCGLDIRPYFGSGRTCQTIWRRWSRCMMGLKTSPYFTIQATHLAFEVSNGDRHDPANALQWQSVILNLPGTADYSPLRPWVYRVTKSGHMAGATPAYVDDLRPVGHSETHCFQVAHQTGSRLGYLGIQNATRKTRPPSQTPGAWAGILAETDGETITVCTSQEKWEKAQRYLTEIQDELHKSGNLDHKSLEQKRGFFVHLQRVYPTIAPYLKGIHLTLDSWRPGRDEDGWLDPDWVPGDPSESLPQHAPQWVSPVPRLADDLTSLQELFRPLRPPKRIIRARKFATCIYGFADASGLGFGSTLALPTGGTLYRYGIWGRDADNSSSNYRELRNVVESLEEAYDDTHLQNCEVHVFTDNSTAEGAYYRGNSPSKLLFELVLRLRRLEMHGNLILHLTHVAGTRMVSQGTDGLSRGLVTGGVMIHQPMLQFVPLHLPACDRCPALLPWIQDWWPTPPVVPLSPIDWFERGHGLSGGHRDSCGMWIPHESSESWFLWAPAPAAAPTALQELGISRHKRPHLAHVFVCPRLFTQKWRKRLHTLADLVLELPAGRRPQWPSTMHEPILIALILPFSTVSPWQLRRSEPLLALGRRLCDLWKVEE